MLEKLKQVEGKYEKIQQQLCSPEILADLGQYRGLMREQKRLEPVVETFRAYQAALGAQEEAQALLDDPEFRALAEEELEQARRAAEEAWAKLKVLLLPRDPNDEKNVIVEIRGGAGGEEAALFSAVLFRMYGMYAETKGWKAEIVNANETELGGFKEVCFSVEGEGAYSRLKFESGVHRVQRVPETESQGRIHTSTVTVAVLPEAGEVDIEINPADLQIDTFRASGAGGQHINKTESAIRITHLPTGVVAQCQNERSQHKNRDMAMKMLQARLYEIMEREHLEKVSQIRGEIKDIAWGSQIRSYVFHPYSMVKDHRTNEEIGNVHSVMDGNLEPFINKFLLKKAGE